ncbi:MAG: LysR family transcriptional regulator [Eggerthellaceae bacterium]|nr:LysR family transcriptional regulator [Eggerthellaceae bacterium]
MEIQQLRYFLAVATCGSYTRAATQCFTTRQNVAHSIENLERECGMVLFERKGNGMVLTPAGRMAACHIDEIVGKVDEFQRLFAPSSPSAQQEETLRIAMSYNFFDRIPEPARAFIMGFDKRLNIIEMSCEGCHEAVCAGTVDLGVVVCMRQDFERCRYEEIGTIDSFVLVSSKSDLAERASISVLDLASRHLVLMSDPGLQYKPLLTQLEQLGYDTASISVGTTASSVLEILRNEAVGVSTGVYAAKAPAGLTAVPLEDSRFRWGIYILQPRPLRHQPAVMRFVKGLRRGCAAPATPAAAEDVSN